MTNTGWRQSASPLYQKLQLLRFNHIVKLQLAEMMHSVCNNKISNCILGFSKVENFMYFHIRNSTKSNHSRHITTVYVLCLLFVFLII